VGNEESAERPPKTSGGCRYRSVSNRAMTLERVPVKSHHLSTVMPALVAGIHVFFAELQQSKAWMAGTSPAMTP
jgi:hypothetical protein